MKTEFVKPELTVEELSTALYQANLKLEKMNKELAQSQKELSEIYVNISHDLRSPVTALRNFLDYLQSLDSKDCEEYGRTVKLMSDRIHYMEQLINDTFLLSAINSSQKILQLETVNMGIYLEDFFYSCEADRKYGKRRLVLEVPEYFPYQAAIDCRMIYRVLDNLSTNALKYSHEGAVITLSADILDKEEILVTVSDTGIGIAREHLTKIFNRTYMVSPARTPGQITGCGMGLAIVKAIIESHKGRVWCESEPGKGSRFRFTLPVTC
ncbi:MAG TPA: HAMP domain-containing sensor histidine kinase [Mobilitalea sp.]|nr:HAMP domain-containing sensor histidine kinase [Mobilitalea sp.]